MKLKTKFYRIKASLSFAAAHGRHEWPRKREAIKALKLLRRAYPKDELLLERVVITVLER